MNLENTVKYHFAKSTLISDSPRATGSDSLTGTDVMAAMGMTVPGCRRILAAMVTTTTENQTQNARAATAMVLASLTSRTPGNSLKSHGSHTPA